MAKLLRRLMFFLQRDRLDQELADEIALHRALTEERLRASGVAPGPAATQTQRVLGNDLMAREHARGIWIAPWIDGISQDVRYGLRALIRNPGFSLAAVATLALAIGATTTIFGVVQAVVLRPLPYQQPDQLAMVWVDDPKRGLHEELASYQLVNDWRGVQAFADLAVVTPNTIVLTDGETPNRVRSAFASANLFPLLGVTPVLGRVFSPDDEQRAEPVAVISHALWQRRFGGSSDVLTKSIVINGDQGAGKQGPRSRRVIGVMPASLAIPSAATDVWEPATTYWRWQRESTERFLIDARRWSVVARLRDGSTIDQARVEMAALGAVLSQRFPSPADGFPGFGVNVVPLIDQLVRSDIQRALWLLLGAVGCLLCIACANVANLLLARGATRGRELAIRATLGAGRSRLVRQLTIESAMLAAGGGAVGVSLATAASRLIAAAEIAGIPRLSETAIDQAVLMVAVACTALAGLFFGALPAYRLSRAAPHDTLKQSGGASEGTAPRRARGLLVIAECALAVMLLCGAGLLIHSFVRLQTVDSGFDASNVALVRVSLSPDLRPAVRPVGDTGAAMFATREDVFHRISERLPAIPGVQSVGAITAFVMSGDGNEQITLEGKATPANAGHLGTADVNPAFFPTMRVPLVKGRLFTRADAHQKIKLAFGNLPKPGVIPPRGAAEPVIVNESFVTRYLEGAEPIGQRFFIGELTGKHYWLEIVGVVGDMHRQGLERQPVPEFYGQLIGSTTDLVVRTAGDPVDMAAAIREAIRSISPLVMVNEITRLEDRLSTLTAPRRFQTWLLALFAISGLSLAIIGIYGLVRYAVAQRTREIGVRIALGANRGGVVRMVIGESMRLPIAGLLLGLAGALGSARVLEHRLFGIAPTDPLTYVAVTITLLGAGLAACWLPARAAAAVDPVVALRCD